jgi:predicted nucleotidyltransferase
MQEVYTLDQIKRRLHPVLKKNHVRKATIFGSYSKGLPQPEAISIFL